MIKNDSETEQNTHMKRVQMQKECLKVNQLQFLRTCLENEAVAGQRAPKNVASFCLS